jgi:hypothetical protein
MRSSPSHQINGGAAGGGNVTSGTFGLKNNEVICKVNKHLGGAGQTVDADLNSAFGSIDGNHKGTGLAYIVTKWTLIKASQETWDQYSPQNIKGLVKGRKVYNRLESHRQRQHGLFDESCLVSDRLHDEHRLRYGRGLIED